MVQETHKIQSDMNGVSQPPASSAAAPADRNRSSLVHVVKWAMAIIIGLIFFREGIHT